MGSEAVNSGTYMGSEAVNSGASIDSEAVNNGTSMVLMPLTVEPRRTPQRISAPIVHNRTRIPNAKPYQTGYPIYNSVAAVMILAKSCTKDTLKLPYAYFANEYVSWNRHACPVDNVRPSFG
jgi:hypothetical protein